MSKRGWIILISSIVIIGIIIYVFYRIRKASQPVLTGGEGNLGNPPVTILSGQKKEYNTSGWKKGDKLYHDGKFKYGFACQTAVVGDAISGNEQGAYIGTFDKKVTCHSSQQISIPDIIGVQINRGINVPIYIRENTENIYSINNK